MSPELIGILGFGVAILAFLWKLSQDMGGLRERMARLEGQVDLLVKFLLDQAKSSKP